MRRCLFLLCLLGGAPLMAAAAQINIPAPERKGFWIGGGLGYGAAKLSCGVCTTEGSRIGGLSGYLRLGATITPSFLIGAEFDLWGGSMTPEDSDSSGVGRFLGSAFATAYWYPSKRLGLYLKGGAGYLSYRIDGDKITLGTFAGTIGAGFEIPVGGGFSILPFVNYLDSANGDVKLDGTTIVANDASVSMWQIGVGTTWN